MDYKERFNKIVGRIMDKEGIEEGERKDISGIEGIDRVYTGIEGYFAIGFNGLAITRSTDDSFSQLDFYGEVGWDEVEDFPALIENWFKDLETLLDKLEEEEDKITLVIIVDSDGLTKRYKLRAGDSISVNIEDKDKLKKKGGKEKLWITRKDLTKLWEE